MKKFATLVCALITTLCCVFSTNAQAQDVSLNDLREAVNEINANCPTGDGDMDLLSCTLDNKNLCFSFILSEDPDDESFTIQEINEALKSEEGDALRATFLIGFLSEETSAGMILGAAQNNRGVSFKFISKKTKKSTSFTISASEIKEVIQYVLDEY